MRAGSEVIRSEVCLGKILDRFSAEDFSIGILLSFDGKFVALGLLDRLGSEFLSRCESAGEDLDVERSQFRVLCIHGGRSCGKSEAGLLPILSADLMNEGVELDADFLAAGRDTDIVNGLPSAVGNEVVEIKGGFFAGFLFNEDDGVVNLSGAGSELVALVAEALEVFVIFGDSEIELHEFLRGRFVFVELHLGDLFQLGGLDDAVGHFKTGSGCDEVPEIAQVFLSHPAEGDLIPSGRHRFSEFFDLLVELGYLGIDALGFLAGAHSAGDGADLETGAFIGEDRLGIGRSGETTYENLKSARLFHRDGDASGHEGGALIKGDLADVVG